MYWNLILYDFICFDGFRLGLVLGLDPPFRKSISPAWWIQANPQKVGTTPASHPPQPPFFSKGTSWSPTKRCGEFHTAGCFPKIRLALPPLPAGKLPNLDVVQLQASLLRSMRSFSTQAPHTIPDTPCMPYMPTLGWFWGSM